MRRTLHTFVILAGVCGIADAGDFNGDGFDDLAIGSPGESTAGNYKSGFVHVVYGSVTGLDTSELEFLSESSLAFPGFPSSRFGAALASGDFDGDGFDELAIGAPQSTVANLSAAGAVYVVAGSATGLDLGDVQTWSQNSPGIKDKVELNPQYIAASIERFGHTLASGDFDADGYDDLAIAVDESLKKAGAAGAVHVLYGSPIGLRAKRNQLWTLDSKGVPGKSVTSAGFGGSLAVGNFDGDAFDDLAIGSHAHFDADTWDAVLVLRGGKKGLSTKKRQWFAPDGDGTDDNDFGSSKLPLAAGDLDGDGRADLVIGRPNHQVASDFAAGEVRIFAGSPTGIDTSFFLNFSRATFGVEGGVTQQARFGDALAIADLDGDQLADLIVGVPGAEAGGQALAGAIQVFEGASGGGMISTANDAIWSRASSGIADVPDVDDGFGAALSVGDFDGDGFMDLGIGVPDDDVSGVSDAGAVHVLYGSSSSLTSTGSDLLVQAGLAAVGEEDDAFGAALR